MWTVFYMKTVYVWQVVVSLFEHRVINKHEMFQRDMANDQLEQDDNTHPWILTDIIQHACFCAQTFTVDPGCAYWPTQKDIVLLLREYWYDRNIPL